MGAFDDLIPQGRSQPQAQPQAASLTGMFDDLMPAAPTGRPANLGPVPSLIPAGGTPNPPDRRFGDFLKPVFGQHNPIAEIADVAIPALDPRSKRPILDRAQDAFNFVASAPLAPFQTSIGRIAEKVTGSDYLRKSEERFVENNPDLVRGLGTIGEVAAGAGPMGQGFQRTPTPRVPKQAAFDDAQRSQAMVNDMRTLGVEPYAPAVAAARTDNSLGAVTQTLADKPFIGTPIQRGARQFSEDMTDAQSRITSGYGQSRTMQGAGANLRSGIEEFKEGRGVDVKAMPDDQLATLAKSPARMETMSDVAAAKYEMAERYLPDDKAKAQPVGKGQERVMAALPNTSAILRDIKRRYGLTINKEEAARSSKGQANTVSLDNTVDFANPRWTGSPNIDQSLNAIAGAKGNWRTGIEGMREIRSMIRRQLSAKADSEVNALSNADLKRLYGAVSRDMEALLTRLESDTRQGNPQKGIQPNPQVADRYAAARAAYKDADTFYARNSQQYESVKGLLNLRSDESAAGAVLTAMRDGTKGNRDLLVNLRRTLPRNVIDEVASSVITELGRPGKRASGATQDLGFSPSKFAAEWNTLSEDGKRLMFGHRPDLKRELDAFARVAQGMKDFEALANNSRTGVSNAVWGAIGAGSASLAQFSPTTLAVTVTTALGTRAAAQYLTSPAYIRWMTRAAQLAQGNAPSGAIAQHMRRLKQITSEIPRGGF